MEIEKKPWKSPWGTIQSCPLCNGELQYEYFMGMQLFTFTCNNCALEGMEEDIPRYKVQLWWGEHVGQNHEWVKTIIDADGTEHVDKHTVMNKYQ